MKLTIIPSDSVVGVDGIFRTVAMTGIDPTIHAVQFDDASSSGEIEYQRRGQGNKVITDRAPFQLFIDRWTEAGIALSLTPEQTKATANAPILAQMAAADLKIIRALTEGDTARITAHVAAQTALRAKLI